MVWSESSREVHAVNVSQRYVDLYAARESEQVKQGTHVWVSFRMFRDALQSPLPDIPCRTCPKRFETGN